MGRERTKGEAILAAGAIAAFCGTTLVALGRTLKFLFRDVDEEQKEKALDTDKADSPKIEE